MVEQRRLVIRLFVYLGAFLYRKESAMSKFLCEKYKNLEPYVPGEHPKDREYIKLNANETSMLPSPRVYEVLRSGRMKRLGFYADPDALELRNAIAEKYEVTADEVFAGNGSDEVLGMIFLAFFDEHSKIAYPDISYGFYKVFAKSFGIDGTAIPLKEDFTVDVDAFIASGRHIILANPNAPTGYVLPVSEIERMVASDENRLVIIDEAYVDYGNETCIPLTKKYKNLIVVHTMSKSRNLAGAHIGYCIADKELIKDLNGMKYSFNPFSLSDFSIAVGTAAMKDSAYYEECAAMIIEERAYLSEELQKLGFEVLESHTNFIFVHHPVMHAKEYQEKLKNAGILTRYFPQERIDNYLRITIGTREEMEAVVAATRDILQKAAA